MFYQFKEGGVSAYRTAEEIHCAIRGVRQEIARAKEQQAELLAAAGRRDFGGIPSLLSLCEGAEDLRARLSLLSDLLDELKEELAESLYATGDG